MIQNSQGQLHIGSYISKIYYTLIVRIYLIQIQLFQMTLQSRFVQAGQMFNLTCTVRTVEGLQNVPTVEWLDETGTRVTTGGDTIVGSAMISGAMTTLALVFSPLRISHGGEFTCRANITSPAPPLQLTKSAEWDLIVDSEYTYRPVILVSFPLKISTLQMVFIRLMSHSYNGSLLCFVHVAIHFWHCMLLLNWFEPSCSQQDL